jgi:predicted enzyme related to lactoylglutathione lyase
MLPALLLLMHSIAAADPSIVAGPTGIRDPGQLVWADLLTDDVAAAQKFYGDVFGWQFLGDDEYLQASRDGVPVAGIAYHEPVDPAVSEVAWLVSISTEDVDKAARAAEAAGGRVLEAARDVPGRGRYAIVEDSQGAVFVLLRSETGDPADRRGVDHEWIWGELWTPDTNRAKRFYADVVGYEARDIEEPDGGSYTLLFKGGKPKTGLVRLTIDNVRPHWLPYLRVADVKETVARIIEAAGGVLIAPADEFDDGTVAIVSDPTGGVFAIQSPAAAQ